MLFSVSYAPIASAGRSTVSREVSPRPRDSSLAASIAFCRVMISLRRVIFALFIFAVHPYVQCVVEFFSSVYIRQEKPALANRKIKIYPIFSLYLRIFPESVPLCESVCDSGSGVYIRYLRLNCYIFLRFCTHILRFYAFMMFSFSALCPPCPALPHSSRGDKLGCWCVSSN